MGVKEIETPIAKVVLLITKMLKVNAFLSVQARSTGIIQKFVNLVT